MTVKYARCSSTLEEVLQTRYVDGVVVGCMHRMVIQRELDVNTVHEGAGTWWHLPVE